MSPTLRQAQGDKTLAGSVQVPFMLNLSNLSNLSC